MENIELGVIGGSGLYSMANLADIEEVKVSTPYGEPSDDIIVGTLHGRRVAFLARHGRGHVLTPSEVPYRANIYALKSLGIRYIIAVSACGSLREDIAPGHIVIPDQLVDFTKHRQRSFFGNGLVAHLSPADPFSAERGRLLFAGPVDFLKGVVAMSGLPPADRVEVCFAGRSNVGKSSLINALTGRKALARASNTPGRTQEINYFTAGDTHYLVDLPGYGYAEAPVAVVAKWQALLKSYLGGRQTLRRAFVLIDMRHGIKKVDDEILTLLDRSAVTFQVVLTKADKIKTSEHEKILTQVRAALQKHPAAYPEIVVTSSEKGEGIETLRAIIATMA